MNIKESWFNFSVSNPPDWECPTCKAGVLNFCEHDFIKNETSNSIRLGKIDVHDPEWIEYGFSAKLTCSNSRCNEVVMVLGDGRVDWLPGEDEIGRPVQEYREFFRPRYFQPNLQPISIPNNCSEYVGNALQEAFKAMFINFELACNQLRVAVEYVVDELVDVDGKAILRNDANGEFISLGRRIDKIRDDFGYFKSFISAIRYVGNAGSHEIGVLKFQDFADALGLVERILKDLYLDDELQTLKGLAIKINKKPKN